MPDSVDISEVLALTQAARESFAGHPREMLRVVADVAEVERRTHEWRNITGLLEKNTRAEVEGHDSDPYTVALVMARHYASNVRKRGRTDIDKRRDEASAEIDFYFDGEAERLSRM
jgi:hypothetical protein